MLNISWLEKLFFDLEENFSQKNENVL